MKVAQLGGLAVAFALLAAVACGPAAQPALAPTTVQPAASAPGAAPAAAPAVPGPGGQGTPKRGGIFRFAPQNADPPLFDAHATSQSILIEHVERTHNRLTRYEYSDKPASLNIVGDLAEKWEASTDAKTWTFTLRKGVKFQNLPPVNGRELVADDVKFSYDRLMTGSTSAWKGLFEFMDRVEVVDKYTVRFHLKIPSASFLHRASDGQSAWIVAKEVVSQPEYGKDPNKSLIGTGPFIFDAYDRGVLLTAKRNPEYFGSGFTGLPYIDGVETLIMGDAAARLAAFVTKQIDWVGVPLADLDRVKSSVAGVQISEKPSGLGSPGIMINVTRPPFDNVKVRQALMYGVSQQNIIDGLYRGIYAEYKGFLGGNPFWSLPESEVKKLWRHDPELSKKLLAEAGYPNGLKSEMLLYDQAAVAATEVVVGDLKKVGIDLTIRLEAAAAGRKMVEEGNFVMSNSAHTGGTNEPDLVVKDGLTPGGSRNFMRLNDPIINKLAAEQTVILNPQERVKVVQEIVRRVAEIVPIVPLPAAKSFNAGHGYIKNFFPRFNGDNECDEQFYWLDK